MLVGCSREPTLIEFMLHSGLQKTLVSKRASVSVRIAVWYRLSPIGPGWGRTTSLRTSLRRSVEWFFRAPLVRECVGVPMSVSKGHDSSRNSQQQRQRSEAENNGSFCFILRKQRESEKRKLYAFARANVDAVGGENLIS